MFESSDDNSSIWSSDSEDENRAASSLEVSRAFFSTANLQFEEPRNDGMLRKTAHAPFSPKISGSSPILNQPIHNGYMNPLKDAFGIPMGHDKEVVGYLTDEQGTPYAQIEESKPPPPNLNRNGQSHKHSLRRALGYDPNYVPRKKEVIGITNAHDPINGDADITDRRRSTKKKLDVLGNSFSNQDHTQHFSTVDDGRTLYEGHNPSIETRKFQENRRPLQHTWRNALRQTQEPKRDHGQHALGSPDWGKSRTVRKETSDPFHRVSGGDHSSVSIDKTLNTPVIVHDSMRESSLDEFTPTAYVDSGSRQQSVVSVTKEAELKHTHNVVESHVSAKRVSTGDADYVMGEREIEGLFMSAQSGSVQSRRIEADGYQRIGTDVKQNSRSNEATTLQTLGESVPASGADRTVQDEISSPQTSPSVMFVSSSVGAVTTERISGDDTDHGDPIRATQNIDAPTSSPSATASGSDVVSVTTTNAHGEMGYKARDFTYDTLLPARADTDTVSQQIRAGGDITGSYVYIGDDRPPTSSCATWHFPTGSTHSDADKQRPQHEINKASAGTHFIGDRLDQPHERDWRRQEARTNPTKSEVVEQDRSTPVSMMRGSMPPLQPQNVAGACEHRLEGRSTPNIMHLKPSPANLR